MTTPVPAVDERRAIVSENLQSLFEPGQHFEIRTVAPRDSGLRALSGVFDDYEAAAVFALLAEQEGQAVYFGLNPRSTQAANELSCGKASRDKDVAERRWLLVDCDPEKQAEGACPSTDEEKKAAKAVLRAVLGWLCRDRGWPAPLLGDSGNGWHALFRVNLPADNGLCERVLAALAARFDTDKAKVDQKVFDPPRICRLYGTLNAKGEESPERPYRFSRLLDGKGSTEAVPSSLLEAVAALAPEARHKTNGKGKRSGTARRARDGQDPEPALLGAANMAKRLNDEGDDDSPPWDAEKVVGRARFWAEGQPAAVEGKEGSKKLCAVACGLLRDFGLSVDEARPLLEEYNERCDPPWEPNASDGVEHTLANAERLVLEDLADEPSRLGWRLLRAEQRGEQASGQTQGDKTKEREADRLVAFVQAKAELWHSPLGEAFATVAVGDHSETHEIASKGFLGWLVSSWFAEEGRMPGKTARDEAKDSLALFAEYEGEPHEAPVRVASTDDGQTVWLDLCDEVWRAVRITASGWEVIEKPPVRFVRFPGALPLPEPEHGGSMDELRPFVSVTDEDWPLVPAWLVGCFLPQGTYAALQSSGRHGSGKTTMQNALRRLVDPSAIKPRVGVPKTERALLVAARSCFVAAYNNVSKIDTDQSDLLCGLAEGAADAERELYTNTGLCLLEAKRPVLINGIGGVAVRSDLLDRFLLVAVSPPAKRRDEAELWAAYEAARPRILGALLSAVATALARVGSVVVPEPKPRLLDFAKFATAAEPALGLPDGSVLAAMRASKKEASQTACEAEPWVPALRSLLEREGEWQGTSTALLAELGAEEKRPAPGTTYPKRSGDADKWPGWPKGATEMSKALDRLAPDLEATGVGWERLPKSHGVRRLRLWLAEGHEE